MKKGDVFFTKVDLCTKEKGSVVHTNTRVVYRGLRFGGKVFTFCFYTFEIVEGEFEGCYIWMIGPVSSKLLTAKEAALLGAL